MSEVCLPYQCPASPGKPQDFPSKFDEDQNGCFSPLEGAQVAPDLLLDCLLEPFSNSLIMEETARAFVDQLKAISLPAYWRLYARNEKRGADAGRKLNLYPSGLPVLSFPDPKTAPEFCDAQIMVPQRHPVETLSMSPSKIYRHIIQGAAVNSLLRVVSQYSSLRPHSRRLIILYAEAHEPADRIHQTTVVLERLIKAYGIGHIAIEFPDKMAPRGCLPGIIGDDDFNFPSISSLLQLMFPELNYFGVEDESLMRNLALQAMAQSMLRKVVVDFRLQKGEIDEAQAQQELKKLDLEGYRFMAVGGVEKRDRAMAANLVSALNSTGAQIILYPVGANHAPRIFRALRHSTNVAVLTLAPHDLVYKEGEASFKQQAGKR